MKFTFLFSTKAGFTSPTSLIVVEAESVELAQDSKEFKRRKSQFKHALKNSNFHNEKMRIDIS